MASMLRPTVPELQSGYSYVQESRRTSWLQAGIVIPGKLATAGATRNPGPAFGLSRSKEEKLMGSGFPLPRE
jgi:hypothetical protein